eukprot:795946-Amphidinium_carterae.1
MLARLRRRKATYAQTASWEPSQVLCQCTFDCIVPSSSHYYPRVSSEPRWATPSETAKPTIDARGTVTDGDRKITEKELNGRELKSSEDAKKARVLFVAHKFETGYDNSALTFLYIFRRVCDSKALATQVMLRHCGKRGGKIRQSCALHHSLTLGC